MNRRGFLGFLLASPVVVPAAVAAAQAAPCGSLVDELHEWIQVYPRDTDLLGDLTNLDGVCCVRATQPAVGAPLSGSVAMNALTDHADRTRLGLLAVATGLALTIAFILFQLAITSRGELAPAAANHAAGDLSIATVRP